MKKEVKSTVSKGLPKISPLGDRVLIKELEVESVEKTAGGIFIPDTVKEDRGAKKGEVLAVGPGKFDDGRHIPMEVKVGDTVLYQWGDTIKIKDEEYVMVSESNLIAIIR
ncbi:MAG: co-chaperone GroES [Candidatus Taylorbacteria bacterium]|nr:co-chaperone GroES [Candidatus Taylorbacteria bacterium]